MSGRIPQDFIDDLVSRTDIVEIIGKRVPLKKKGKEYSACCPFHNEKTPSFTVSEQKQFYHCFGCGAHGTAVGFLMEYENLDFIEAIETLASENNVDVPRENSNNYDHQSSFKKNLYDLMESVCSLFQDQLKNSERAISYLKQRQLTGEVAKKYRLGYAPDSWNFLTDKLGNDPSMLDQLSSVGLVVKKNTKTYDRFRDRIIFPIIDIRGRVIGFGGRVIDKGEPKYLNSPENTLFHKGYELYGLREAKLTTNDLKRIIIVEGYMDVVALSQHGITYAVASLGTATTRDQIQKTLRSCSEIIFCYDGDTAGTKAAWRALENTLPVIRDGQVAKFLLLPEKEDPDSLVRKEGKTAFEQRLDNATALSDFLFNTLKQEIDLGTEDGKARFFEQAKPLITSMADSLFKDLLTDKLSALIGVNPEKLHKRIPGNTATHRKATRPAINHKSKAAHSTTRKAIALLLQNPFLAKEQAVPESFSNTDIQGLPLLFQIYDSIKNHPELTTAALIERFRGSEDEHIIHKLVELDIPGSDEVEQSITLYMDYLRALNTKYNEAAASARQLELEAKFTSGQMTTEERQEYLSLIAGKT